MKALLILPLFALASCVAPFVGSILTPFGTGSYSPESGTVLVVDAGAIADAILKVDAAK
tara:strand:+ start:819 stop:995 length:177 start_codon:yes stop_codon:yes gene_type:complete